MEKSKVYFTDMRVKAFGENLLGKLTKLITKAGIGTIDFQNRFAAIKIHFGESGNLSYLRPNFARVVVEKVRHRTDHSGNHLLGDEHRGGDQSVRDLHVVVRGHILSLRRCDSNGYLLEHVDDHETELVFGSNTAGSSQISNLLQVDVRICRQLHIDPFYRNYLNALDISEGAVMTKHFTVDHTQHVLLCGALSVRQEQQSSRYRISYP